jgi:hypothetical protein
MQKKALLLGLVALLTIGLMGSSALAGPRVAIVKAAPAQWDLVLNSWHNNLRARWPSRNWCARP